MDELPEMLIDPQGQAYSWGDTKLKLTPSSIFAFALGIYFVAVLIPKALDTFFNQSTTGWDSSSVALWGLIPLAIIGAVVFIFIKGFGSKGE